MGDADLDFLVYNFNGLSCHFLSFHIIPISIERVLTCQNDFRSSVKNRFCEGRRSVRLHFSSTLRFRTLRSKDAMSSQSRMNAWIGCCQPHQQQHHKKPPLTLKTNHEEETFYRSGDISGDGIDSIWNDRSVWIICQKTMHMIGMMISYACDYCVLF